MNKPEQVGPTPPPAAGMCDHPPPTQKKLYSIVFVYVLQPNSPVYFTSVLCDHSPPEPRQLAYGECIARILGTLSRASAGRDA